jgi:hypothetical protein
MSDPTVNPYLVDLSFEADLCLRQIQASLLTQRSQWRTPAEIITEALYVFADYWRGRGDPDDDDDHHPPDPPGPLPRPDDADAADIELRELVMAHSSPHASRERS